MNRLEPTEPSKSLGSTCISSVGLTRGSGKPGWISGDNTPFNSHLEGKDPCRNLPNISCWWLVIKVINSQPPPKKNWRDFRVGATFFPSFPFEIELEFESFLLLLLLLLLLLCFGLRCYTAKYIQVQHCRWRSCLFSCAFCSACWSSQTRRRLAGVIVKRREKRGMGNGSLSWEVLVDTFKRAHFGSSHQLSKWGMCSCPSNVWMGCVTSQFMSRWRYDMTWVCPKQPGALRSGGSSTRQLSKSMAWVRYPWAWHDLNHETKARHITVYKCI